MATSKEYAAFIADKFAGLEGVVSIRPMMGEYVIHMAGKVLGFLGDGQLLLEPGPAIAVILPDAERRELFPGSKLMYVVDDSIGARQLCEIAQAIYDDLPVSKPRRRDRRSASPNASADDREAEIERRFPFSKYVK